MGAGTAPAPGAPWRAAPRPAAAPLASRGWGRRPASPWPTGQRRGCLGVPRTAPLCSTCPPCPELGTRGAAFPLGSEEEGLVGAFLCLGESLQPECYLNPRCFSAPSRGGKKLETRRDAGSDTGRRGRRGGLRGPRARRGRLRRPGPIVAAPRRRSGAATRAPGALRHRSGAAVLDLGRALAALETAGRPARRPPARRPAGLGTLVDGGARLAMGALPRSPTGSAGKLLYGPKVCTSTSQRSWLRVAPCSVCVPGASSRCVRDRCCPPPEG